MLFEIISFLVIRQASEFFETILSLTPNKVMQSSIVQITMIVAIPFTE